MKAISLILSLCLLCGIASAEPGDLIAAKGKTQFEICDIIEQKMSNEFNAESSKDINAKNVYSIFEYSNGEYNVIYEVFFIVKNEEFFYRIEYTIDSLVDKYNFIEDDKFYVLLNQDISYIQMFIEHMF